MADEQRIAVLEQHVRSLYEQIAALRKELAEHGQRAPAEPRMAEPLREPVRPAAPVATVAPNRTTNTPRRRLLRLVLLLPLGRAPHTSRRRRSTSKSCSAATAPSRSHYSRFSWVSAPFSPGRSSTGCSGPPCGWCWDSSVRPSSPEWACGCERSATSGSATCSSRSRWPSFISTRGLRVLISTCSRRSSRSQSPPSRRLRSRRSRSRRTSARSLPSDSAVPSSRPSLPRASRGASSSF